MIGDLLLLKSKSVLYVDTDSREKVHITKVLKILFDKVIVTDNDKDALALYEDESPDLVITDINSSSDINGVKLIKQLRQTNYRLPIIIVTKKSDANILIDIANLAIDAYLYKPIDPEILTKVICRSIKRNPNESGLAVLDKHLIFNTATKELYQDGSVVALGAKEHQLLLLLLENRSKTVTKEEIEKKIWPLESVSDSAIKKLILRIRQKMKTNIILSVRGIGYRIDTAQIKTQKLQKTA